MVKDSTTNVTVKVLKQRAVKLSNEINMREQLIKNLEKTASRKSTALCWLGSSVVFAQLGFIAWGSFHMYSWDIIEPICYLMTFGNFTFSYFFYLFYCLARIQSQLNGSVFNRARFLREMQNLGALEQTLLETFTLE